MLTEIVLLRKNDCHKVILDHTGSTKNTIYIEEGEKKTFFMTRPRLNYSETQKQTSGELGRRPCCTCAVADKILV